MASVVEMSPEAMPAEFTDPVGYSSIWLWLAILAIVLVVGWFAAVTLWAHGREWAEARRRPTPASARDRALFELDRIGHQVVAGAISERIGYQQMSQVIRHFVAESTGLPVHSMALSDLRAAGASGVADAVALMYPPEFAPSPAPQYEPILHTLARARHLVATWM